MRCRYKQIQGRQRKKGLKHARGTNRILRKQRICALDLRRERGVVA